MKITPARGQETNGGFEGKCFVFSGNWIAGGINVEQAKSLLDWSVTGPPIPRQCPDVGQWIDYTTETISGNNQRPVAFELRRGDVLNRVAVYLIRQWLRQSFPVGFEFGTKISGRQPRDSANDQQRLTRPQSLGVLLLEMANGLFNESTSQCEISQVTDNGSRWIVGGIITFKASDSGELGRRQK